MRFSAAVSICAAPLALAGSLQAELFKREVVGVDIASEQVSGKKNNNNNVNAAAALAQFGNFAITESSIADIIVIWVNNGGNAATTTVNAPAVTQTVTAAANGAATVAAAAATHTVVVGGTSKIYTPNSITANVGDMVVFQFMNANHTVTQSAFTTPCEKLSGGFDSGFVPNVNNSVSPAPAMAMQVNVTTPIWFYCRQTGHCGEGMTFSINPTANKTQAMFEQMAIAQNGTGSATAITGGTSSAAPVASAASAAAPAATSAGTGLTAGTGTTNADGSCDCQCLCGTAAFPLAAQGLNAFGGMAGAMPQSALEARRA